MDTYERNQVRVGNRNRKKGRLMLFMGIGLLSVGAAWAAPMETKAATAFGTAGVRSSSYQSGAAAPRLTAGKEEPTAANGSEEAAFAKAGQPEGGLSADVGGKGKDLGSSTQEASVSQKGAQKPAASSGRGSAPQETPSKQVAVSQVVPERSAVPIREPEQTRASQPVKKEKDTALEEIAARESELGETLAESESDGPSPQAEGQKAAGPGTGAGGGDSQGQGPASRGSAPYASVAKDDVTFALVTNYWGWGVEIFKKPDFLSEKIDTAYPGDYYRILQTYQSGWARISYGGGDAYLYLGGDVEEVGINELAERDSLRSSIVNYALQFVGNAYVWGGTDPNTGADCSGFVQYVYKHAAGVQLDRTTREQVYNGTMIHALEMRPGDLMFYGDTLASIHHVTMYIGNGQVVHASDSKSGIKISPWNYRDDWICVVNVLGDGN